MKRVLLDLFTSKKFLAALTAIIVYIAGRFGFDVDTAVLDRIYAALLVYVGAQGIADTGKSAASVRAAAPLPAGLESSAALQTRAIAPIVVLALVVLGVGTLPSCGAAQRAGTAAIDCVAADRAKIDALIVDLATKTKPDGTRDWAAIEAEAIADGLVIGGCALAEFVTSYLPSSALSARTGTDPAAQATLERVRARFDGARWRTAAGVR